MMTAGNKETINVILKPFAHQVSGHNPVLTIGDSIICKPKSLLEEQFYRNPPEELTGYIPAYKGTVEVTCRNRDCDSPELSAHVPRSYIENTEKLSERDSTTRSSRKETEVLTNGSSKAFVRRLIETKGYWSTSITEDFILLENVIAGFRYPCIMDIKLGTSNLTGTEDDHKRKLLQDRLHSTTSSSHGIRLHGMRVIKYPQNQYEIRKKDWGREYSKSEETLKQALQSYFHNGLRFREDVWKRMSKKLRDLQTRGLTQRKYKLYACSLLLLYDGEPPETLCENEKSESQVIVKLIDFAKTSTSDINEKSDIGGIEFGIRNILRILETIVS